MDAKLEEVKLDVVADDDSSADVASSVGDEATGPSVHTHSRCLFLLPATGVSGQESLSDSESDESLLSPALGYFVLNLAR